MFSKGISCIWLYRIFLVPVVLVQTRKNFTFVSTDNTLYLLGFLNGSIYLRDRIKVYEVDTLELSKERSGRLCSSPCGPNSIVLLNSAKNVILVCGRVNNGFCSVRNLSDFTPLINASSDGELSSVSVAVSSRTSRPAIGIVTYSGGMYVAVTYGPGIKPDRFGGNISFHETYKFVISRMKWNGKILNRDKSLPFRLPRNVHLDEYLIFFKGGFANQNQLFFLTNQKFKVGENQQYTSKLLSICRTDPYFYSYTDIVLECRYKDRRYNLIQDTHVVKADGLIRKTFNLLPTEDEDVLVGIFASGDDPDQPQTSSAVCLYSFKDIRSKLKEARQKFIICPGSNLTENERYLDNNVQGGCLTKNAATADLGEDCRQPWPLYSYVIGDVVLSAQSVFELNSTYGRLTKVFVQTFKDDHIGEESVVLYGGTSAGKILTLSQRVSSGSFQVFDELDIDPGHSIEALRVDEEHNIYAMSNRKLVKYGVFDCDRYSSCEAMTHSFNPFCGWCVYQSRSVHLRNPECQNMHRQNHLLSYSRSCPSLIMRSERFEVNKVTQIFFHVERLPEPLIGDEYYCEFKYDHGATVDFTAATRGENDSFTCNTPTASHHSKAVLKLLVSTTSVTSQSRHNITLASHPILFYDCRYFTRCQGCTGNIHHRCIWLLQDGRCTSKVDSSATSVNVTEALFCPKVLHSSRTVPVTHAKVPVNVFVDVANVHEFMKLACCTRGNRCSNALFVNASMIQCAVQVDTNTSYLTVPVQVKYANEHLPGSNSYEVTVYNCRHLARDCNQCKALNSTKYQCLWCHDGHSNYCGYTDAKGCIPENNCPPPVITKVSPSSAPVRGGTIVTVSGHEIGASPESIAAIKLAGIDCHLIPEGYILSKQAVCEAGDASNVTEEANYRGQVQITVYNITSSGLSFFYKNPVPRTVHPVSGPQAGGTAMTISGRNLDIGNRRVVACFVTDDSRRLCGNATVVEAFSNASEQHLKMVMPSAGYASEVTDMEVTFDGKTLRKMETKYRFLKDPVIETIVPKKSISSGGIKVTVFGRQLKNANDAKILITYKNHSKFRKCKFKSHKEVICRTPSLYNADLSFAGGTAVNSSIHLDGVIEKFNLEYFVDPQIGSDIVNSSTYLDVIYGHLFIEGRHLNLAATESDIRVMVGHAQCPIVSFNETTIECMVPKKHHKEAGEVLQVNVTIGDLHKLVGYIREPEVSAEDSSTFLTIIILASLIGVLGIVVLIVAIRSLKICTRKNKERLRYLTMSKMNSHDTPILPEGERRHSNGNIYEVINDLHVADGRTHSEGTDVTDDLKHVEDDAPSYQSLDCSPKTERGEPFQLAANTTGYRSELPTDLNCDDIEDDIPCKKTYKDCYLTPMVLKRESSKEN